MKLFTIIKKSIKFYNKKWTLNDWAKEQSINLLSDAKHLLTHCNVQFFWNGKITFKTELDKIDLGNMELKIKVNLSDIIVGACLEY